MKNQQILPLYCFACKKPLGNALLTFIDQNSRNMVATFCPLHMPTQILCQNPLPFHQGQVAVLDPLANVRLDRIPPASPPAQLSPAARDSNGYFKPIPPEQGASQDEIDGYLDALNYYNELTKQHADIELLPKHSSSGWIYNQPSESSTANGSTT